MKPCRPNPAILIVLCCLLAFGILSSLSAQQKFAVQFSDGTCKYYSLDGLKLTFDNNGLFSIWHNGTKEEMNFAAVNNLTFTDLPVNILTNKNIPSLSSYIDPSGTLRIIGESEGKTEICIFSVQGMALFKKEQSISVPIDISNLYPGVYMLKAGNQYIKFLKP